MQSVRSLNSKLSLLFALIFRPWIKNVQINANDFTGGCRCGAISNWFVEWITHTWSVSASRWQSLSIFPSSDARSCRCRSWCNRRQSFSRQKPTEKLQRSATDWIGVVNQCSWFGGKLKISDREWFVPYVSEIEFRSLALVRVRFYCLERAQCNEMNSFFNRQLSYYVIVHLNWVTFRCRLSMQKCVLSALRIQCIEMMWKKIIWNSVMSRQTHESSMTPMISWITQEMSIRNNTRWFQYLNVLGFCFCVF